MPALTVYREVPDLYNEDPEATVEIAVDVAYSRVSAEPDVGLMSAGWEDLCVEATDSDLMDKDEAQYWLDMETDKQAARALDKINEHAAEYEAHDDQDYSYWWDYR